MELLSVAVAAGISSFPVPVSVPVAKGSQGTWTQHRRCCASIIRHACVLLTGIGLPGEKITDEGALDIFLQSCSVFLSLSVSRGPGPSGTLVGEVKVHYTILSERGKRKCLKGIQVRKHLSDGQRSIARKLTRFIKKDYLEGGVEPSLTV